MTWAFECWPAHNGAGQCTSLHATSFELHCGAFFDFPRASTRFDHLCRLVDTPCQRPMEPLHVCRSFDCWSLCVWAPLSTTTMALPLVAYCRAAGGLGCTCVSHGKAIHQFAPKSSFHQMAVHRITCDTSMCVFCETIKSLLFCWVQDYATCIWQYNLKPNTK